MKNLNKLIKGHKHIIFMDFEGTQFSHEMIAISAVVATLDRNNAIKTLKPPFKRYVKAKNKVGSYVSKLTNITDEDLKNNGVLFSRALKEFKTYCGRAWNSASFVTFGNHDLKILTSSISYTLDYPKDITSDIQKNYYDFTVLLNEFVKDEHNNALSLLKACELFEVEIIGEHHDPAADCINLAHLYDAFIRRKDILLDEYIKVLTKHTSLPTPILRIIQSIGNGKSADLKTLKEFARDYING